MFAKYSLYLLLLFLAGYSISCTSQAPVATNYPYTEQRVMQAGHHWQQLATDVVEQLEGNFLVSKTVPMAVMPDLYLQDRDERVGQVPFSRAYRNYLVNELVNAGFNVTDDPNSAEMKLIFDLQVIKHNNRKVRGPNLISQLGRIIATGIDGAYDGIKPGQYEVLITTSVKRGHNYISCHSGTYYINKPKWENNYSSQGATMEVVDK